MIKNRVGFTLIELLVVVLIIAILAAVALPQYQKAVWRSRNVQLKHLLVATAQAQQTYYLANDKYAKRLNELDISLPAWKSESVMSADGECQFRTSHVSDAARVTDNLFIGISENSNIIVGWRSGPYKCGGFMWTVGTNKMMCVERQNAPFTQGDFCVKLERAVYNSRPSTWRHYDL